MLPDDSIPNPPKVAKTHPEEPTPDTVMKPSNKVEPQVDEKQVTALRADIDAIMAWVAEVDQRATALLPHVSSSAVMTLNGRIPEEKRWAAQGAIDFLTHKRGVWKKATQIKRAIGFKGQLTSFLTHLVQDGTLEVSRRGRDNWYRIPPR